VRTIALAVAAIALAALVVACGGGRDEETVATPTAEEAPRQPVRDPAPAIEGVTLDGERISLAGFRGRSVLINVWSSW
jgi:hypothetical protein